jgi:hypothetical protein
MLFHLSIDQSSPKHFKNNNLNPFSTPLPLLFYSIDPFHTLLNDNIFIMTKRLDKKEGFLSIPTADT